MKSHLRQNKGSKPRSKALISDGLFVVENQRGFKESVALELELSIKSKKRYKKIFEIYDKKERLKYLWYIVQSKAQGEKLLRLWLKFSFRHREKVFLFSVLDEVLKDPKTATVYLENERKPLSEFWIFKEDENFACSQACSQGEQLSEQGEGFSKSLRTHNFLGKNKF